MLLEILDRYASLSGQKVNYHKSSVFFHRRIPPATQDLVLQSLQMRLGNEDTLYLGMPLMIGRARAKYF